MAPSKRRQEKQRQTKVAMKKIAIGRSLTARDIRALLIAYWEGRLPSEYAQWVEDRQYRIDARTRGNARKEG